MTPPPPPEPAFTNWCAEQLVPPALCERLHPAAVVASWSYEVWTLMFFLALMLGVLFAYVVWFSRRAYIGGRFCEALGGYSSAAQHLEKIEAANEARVFVGMDAHARHNLNRTPQ